MFYSQTKEEEIRNDVNSFFKNMEMCLNSGLTFLESLATYLLDCQDYGTAYIVLEEALKKNPDSEYAKKTYSNLTDMKKLIMASSIYDKKYVITGALLGMERETALNLISLFGGKISDNPVNDMDVLVVGYCEWSELNNGRPTRKILKAQELQKKGKKVQIISDEKFLNQLSSLAKQILSKDSYKFFFENTNYYN